MPRIVRTRLEAAKRRKEILDAAVLACDERDYRRITRREIAEVAGTSPSLVAHYLGTATQIRRATLKHAIDILVLGGTAYNPLVGVALAILLRGLLERDPIAKKAPEKIRKKAAELLQ